MIPELPLRDQARTENSRMCRFPNNSRYLKPVAYGIIEDRAVIAFAPSSNFPTLFFTVRDLIPLIEITGATQMLPG